ncbi:MAG: hypothetical protein IID40_09175 [Planctomycetes bacterium]|nr:hypothetical protein [Planctomycetota bacterium]
MFFRVQEAQAWLVPQGWKDPAFVAVLHLTVGRLKGGPGIVIAVLIACRRAYPWGYCRRWRYDFTGNVRGRCPECGRAAR